MDTLTHTCIGACLGQAIAGRKIGKKAMLFGVIANNLPDIDVLSHFWSSETHALLLHRGITHSLLAVCIATPLLAWICKTMFKNLNLTHKQWLLLFGSGLFIHILLDAFTSYGTGWFEPFSHARVSFNAMFIFDPILALPLLVGTIALLILRSDSIRRQPVANVCLSLAGLYLCYIVVIKCKVNNIVKAELDKQRIVCDAYMATPTPLNNILWYIVIRSGERILIGYYSLLDKDKNISFTEYRRNDSLITAPTAQVEDIKRFSKGYYRVERNVDTLEFSDVRFGQIGGWNSDKAPFVFTFKMAAHYSNATALQRGRFKGFGDGALRQLFARIAGKK